MGKSKHFSNIFLKSASDFNVNIWKNFGIL